MLIVTLAVAILLGLRHATDPDHLAAVSALVACEGAPSARSASALGLWWGLGHGSTLFLLGLPIVLFGRFLPDAVQQAAEVFVGAVIIALAVRLYLRWRRGGFHAHRHSHRDGVVHRHLHAHASGSGGGDAARHAHRHRGTDSLGRSPLQALAIGAVHGVGGSAGIGALLLADVEDGALAVAALGVFAVFTAVSMAVASTAFGYALARGPVRRRLATLAPALAALGTTFGTWYALGALDAVPYVF